MRKFIGLLTLAMSLGAQASTVETQKFTYDGSQNSIQMSFRGEQTHTEYKVEQVPSTCYREEIVGYSTMCTNGGFGGGYGGGYGHPFPGPGPVGPYGYPRPFPGGHYPGPSTCYQQPIYRSVPYSCIQTVRTPFEVKDYDVDAKVLLDVSKVSNIASVEDFRVTVTGEKVSLDVTGSKKFLVVVKKQDVRGTLNGSVKFVDAFFAVELIEAAPLLNTLKMTNIELYNDVLSFNIGKVSKKEFIGFNLKIEKQKILASDRVIIDRDLKDSEVVLKTSANGTVVDVNMNTAGVQFSSGKFEITAKAFINAGGRVLNASQFGESLETSRMLIYKIR